MDDIYSIKNFRVVGNDGVSLPIKPMTILTGCNSSGKSSIVKSMVLLDSYLEKLQEDFKAYSKIDLTKSTKEAKEEIFSQFDIANLHGVIK